MLTGQTLRVKPLHDSCGASHTITVLLPEATQANSRALTATERAWTVQTAAQPAEQRHRGQLAVDTALLAAMAVTRPRDGYYIVAAQDETGTVRGLSLFTFTPTPAPGVWELDLHVVSPHDQLGSPKDCVTRGIGSEMLGADMAIMTSRACTRTELHPLDEKADRFWRARGFVPDAPDELGLSCPGMQGLAAAYANSPTDDEDMVAMEPEQLRRVSFFAYYRRVDTIVAARGLQPSTTKET